MQRLVFPDDINRITTLKAGAEVLLTGIIYTARDAAHQRLCAGKRMPLDLAGQTIYYCGPTPEKSKDVIGACGPTTSGRMDPFTPTLLDRGLKVMIGKGLRSGEVVASIKKNKAIYCVTYGGCAAYLQQFIMSKECVAYAELGAEAIYRLEVRDFPVLVAIDSGGKLWSSAQ